MSKSVKPKSRKPKVQQAKPELWVELSHCPNPDIQGGYWSPTHHVRPELVQVNDYQEASWHCRAFIIEHNLGAGNWDGGTIYQGKDRKVKLGSVSYNGRVWPPEKWHEGMKPIWEPNK